ncbi:type II toxin-antitoxin system CcdA family antitoxin [Brucella sp. NBRC 12953]|uniref:type II toxin-antitoxin system CcdA family antitoxin n=1 Tax=Brucella sp. NBRC 12953 TaxID=3075481 RepID=UPI003340EF03
MLTISSPQPLVRIAQAPAAAKSALWKQDNRSAMQSAHAWLEENGMPLECYRQF